MAVLHFISDLHLVESKPALSALFFDYMNNYSPQSDELYVLGDLFEVWLGDDVETPLSTQVIQSFSRYVESGRKLYFQHGNRDFLLGEDFEERTKGKLLPEPSKINWQGKHICLVHGDSLCTDDAPYQQLRQMVRNPEWQAQFLSQSIDARIQFAKDVQAKSKSDQQNKSAEIMDVNDSAVKQCFIENKSDWLIHGHTHRPGTHELKITNLDDTDKVVKRIVLSDWNDQGHFLELKDGEFEHHYFN